MAPPPSGSAARIHPQFGDPAALHEFFTHQRTSSEALPDPEPFLTNLTRGVLEVLAGVREVDQLARWLTEDAYRKLVGRANLATRARSARGVPASRPKHAILSVRHDSPPTASSRPSSSSRARRARAPSRSGSRAWTAAGARHPSPSLARRRAGRLSGRPARSVLGVDEFEQLLGRLRDLGVVVLRGPALRRDHSGAVHLAEVAEGKAEAALRLARSRSCRSRDASASTRSSPRASMNAFSSSAVGAASDQASRSSRTTLPSRTSARACRSAGSFSSIAMPERYARPAERGGCTPAP